MDEFVILLFSDVDSSDQVRLQQLALNHHLGQVGENVEDAETALAQCDGEGLHVKPVTGQHADLVAPQLVRRRVAAAHLRAVDDIVMHQRCGMDDLHHGSHADRPVAMFPASAGRQQQQSRPESLSAAGAQVPADRGDHILAADGVQGYHLVDPLQVGRHQ